MRWYRWPNQGFTYRIEALRHSARLIISGSKMSEQPMTRGEKNRVENDKGGREGEQAHNRAAAPPGKSDVDQQHQIQSIADRQQ